MASKIAVTVGDKEYKVTKTKAKELELWLEENSEVLTQTSEDLIIDIEDTIGVEIEYNELAQEGKKKDETRREQTE